jgi:hypothetical protein
LFTVANAVLIVVTAGGVALATAPMRGGVAFTGEHEHAFNAAWLLAAYIVGYVGLNRMILRRMSSSTLVGPMLGLICLIILVLIGTIFPLIVQFSLQHYMMGGDDYTMMQLPNVFWTAAEVIDGDLRGGGGLGVSLLNGVCLIVSAVAGVIFLLNLMTLSSGLTVTRLATPARVKEDDAELYPVAEAIPTRTNPWDDET